MITEFGHLLALDDLNLGKTSLVKYIIKLTNQTQFKESHRRIPLSKYEEVRKHLKEMLEVGVIRKSNSPWASTVVLVRKKDRTLRFCIDLRRLNKRMVRDVYSLPRIDEILDCLNGVKLFTALDLKCRYWQVELDEASKPIDCFHS